ncbi:MAG: hypothetical protein WDM87_13915 [Terracidiphilus sp.]
MRESVRAALIAWAQRAGEASSYTDNLPLQCLHPVGHWYEIPNLLRSGVLEKMLQARPAVALFDGSQRRHGGRGSRCGNSGPSHFD